MPQMLEFTHPAWDCPLIVSPQGWRGIIRDCAPNEVDSPDLVVKPIEMTQDEIDALPEWDG